MTDQISYAPPHQFTPKEYVWRVEYAEQLAKSGWEGHPDFEKWRNRYANWLTGLSEHLVRWVGSIEREKRIEIAEDAIRKGADLDGFNCEGMLL